MRGDADGLQSQAIDWLRFPLAVAVVFIHSSYAGTSPIDVAAMQADPLSAMSLYNWLRICFSHVLTHIAVPAFFVISGFLFFRNWQRWDKQLYLKKMKSRFRTLAVPYLCWNGIAVLLLAGVRNIGAFLLKGEPLSSIPLFFEENGFLRLFWSCPQEEACTFNGLGLSVPVLGMPIDAPLWFVRDLIVMMVLAPLFYWLLKKTRFYGVCMLFLYMLCAGGMMPGLDGVSVFFFGLGAYFAICGKNLVAACRRVRALSYVLAVGLLFPLIWFDGHNTVVGARIYHFYIVAGTFAVFNLAADLLERGKTRVHPLLPRSSFFIYATHTLLVLGISRRLLSPLGNLGHPLASATAYLLTPLLAVAICLGLFMLMRRWLPRTLGVLTGNRF